MLMDNVQKTAQICVYLHWWLAKALLCDTLRYEALHKDILNFACLPVV